MRLDPDFVHRLIFGTRDRGGERRFTQDSPILPDVWQAYGEAPAAPLDLLLTPHIRASAGAVGQELRARLLADRSGDSESDPPAPRPRVSYNQFHVVAPLTFSEAVRLVLPMTGWWRHHIAPRRESFLEALSNAEKRVRFAEYLERDFRGEPPSEEYLEEFPDFPAELLWMANLAGAIAWAQKQTEEAADATHAFVVVRLGDPIDFEDIARAIRDLLRDAVPADFGPERSVWTLNRNRGVEPCIARSVPTVKADAARQLFDIHCKDILWAVLDSGIDARHPAFRVADVDWDGSGGGDDIPTEGAAAEPPSDWWNHTRVERTYDFRRVRDLLDPDVLADPPPGLREVLGRGGETLAEDLADLRRHLLRGRQVDWGLLEPYLRVPHGPDEIDETPIDRYEVPESGHGTHVAGILGAGPVPGDPSSPIGVCPDIRIYDFRVLGPGGDEFSVISALQFISWLNSHKDYLVLHGANLSLSIAHDVQSYACGATPVCEEANRLVASGVVVVAAAGNQGYRRLRTDEGPVGAFADISITDPGNAESVITVGATHRFSPHTYGVSYFSSRGPTGDGRAKPDLLAPGEKIDAPLPDGRWGRKDGTSMAAPHVSGAAALLMARHTELMGQAGRIKEILLATATDLGRERSFQGHGMVDVLRALQSV